MASSLDPRIIVLALGAGALGFPDALRVLLLDTAGRSPVTDIAICVFAMAVVTAQALGAMLLARFVRKARAGGDDAPPPRTDGFTQVTLVVSLAVSFLVSACLLVASGGGAGAGARGLGLLQLVADVARETKSPVIAVLAAVLPCARPLLRVFRRAEDHSHGAAAAFLLAVSGSLYMRGGRGSLAGAAAFIGTMLFALFTRKARDAAGAGGGRAAPASTSTRGASAS